jgi:hypothetical protein
MKNVSDKFVEKMKAHILCSITPPPTPQKNHAVFEIVRKSIIEPDKALMTVWHMLND